jgi:endonuclease-8
MPEGDTIFRAARTLHRALAGKTVVRFETRFAQLARADDDAPIAGRRILGVEARGKHCLVRFSDDLVLRTHMRMNGSWHIYRPGERWQRAPHRMRIRIEVADFVAVGFDIPVAELCSERELERDRAIAGLGPDLLGASFDVAEAVRRARSQDARAIADVLLDQRSVSGAGNVFKSETLFVCGVNPFATTRQLDDAKLAAIFETARRLLQSGAKTARDRMLVYGREGQPCRRCAAPIEMRKQGEYARSTYFCPGCQRDPVAAAG